MKEKSVFELSWTWDHNNNADERVQHLSLQHREITSSVKFMKVKGSSPRLMLVISSLLSFKLTSPLHLSTNKFSSLFYPLEDR